MHAHDENARPRTYEQDAHPRKTGVATLTRRTKDHEEGEFV